MLRFSALGERESKKMKSFPFLLVRVLLLLSFCPYRRGCTFSSESTPGKKGAVRSKRARIRRYTVASEMCEPSFARFKNQSKRFTQSRSCSQARIRIYNTTTENRIEIGPQVKELWHFGQTCENRCMLIRYRKSTPKK